MKNAPLQAACTHTCGSKPVTKATERVIESCRRNGNTFVIISDIPHLEGKTEEKKTQFRMLKHQMFYTVNSRECRISYNIISCTQHIKGQRSVLQTVRYAAINHGQTTLVYSRLLNGQATMTVTKPLQDVRSSSPR